MTPRLPRKGQRNSVLAALEIARRSAPALSVTELVAFLYVCENEGLNMRELSQLMGLSDRMISRISRRLATAGSAICLPPAFGLLDIRVNPSDRRGRTLHLSSVGEVLMLQFETCISQARPIRAELTRELLVGSFIPYDLSPGT